MEEISEHDFKKKVKEWIRLDSEIKNAGDELKDVRKRCNENKKKIKEFMERNNIQMCNISGGEEVLELVTRTSKVKPKKDQILRRLSEFFNGDNQKAIEVYDFIFEHVETTTSTSLKRSLTQLGKQRRKNNLQNEQQQPSGNTIEVDQ